MSNQGKTETIRQLRKEVGFGCPVCRSPFLEWHHFDPPWNEEKHWRAEGIVALCRQHHGEADAGLFSKGELRVMKTADYSARPVSANFISWQKEELLVRVGGCYTDTSAPVVCIDGEPQIALRKNDAGILELSFQLRDQDDRPIVAMQENSFVAFPDCVHDMTVTPKTTEVTVWAGKDDIGLRLTFDRIAVDALDRILKRDRSNADVKAHRVIEALSERAGFELGRPVGLPEGLPPWAAELPPELREAILSSDPVGSFVMRWVKEHALDDDGLIPFLDFDQMSMWHHGRKAIIKDGIGDWLTYCAAFKSGRGAINLT